MACRFSECIGHGIEFGLGQLDAAEAVRTNPEKPPKKSHQTFEGMAKTNKPDIDTFRVWAKSNGGAKRAFDDIDKTAKVKPADPARVAAMKAIDGSMQDYCKNF